MMNMQTSPLAATAADGASSLPLPKGLLPLLAEHRRLRRITQHTEDDNHPADQRMYAIEDILCARRPASLPEAAALLRWAVARHPNTFPNDYGISSDAMLRGEEPSDEQVHHFDFCERSMWYVVQFLQKMLDGDPITQRAAWDAALAKHERAKELHERAAKRHFKTEAAMFADRESEANRIAAEKTEAASDRALERADLALDAIFELPAPDLDAVSEKLSLLEKDHFAAADVRMECIRADLARLGGFTPEAA